ncbi:MAG: phosphate acyltransferase PlsX [Clostridia bacterium]|nr:phosphate acyltransferase PlsX [Clostridia bacterium]
MKIILDAMGGDNAPAEIVKGAVLALRTLDEGLSLILVGDESAIRASLAENDGASYEGSRIEIVHADEVLTMEDDPFDVMRKKKNCSMAVALHLLADGRGDALVCAGNTGALYTGATMIVRTVKGIRRAAIATILPFDRPALLLDCGANINVTSEYMEQFAFMGAVYMEKIFGIKEPEVGLINNGAEPHKGIPVYVETYERLSNNDTIRFVGNVEGKEIYKGKCDVLVADGFTGNIVLKLIEGMGIFFTLRLKRMFMENVVTKFSALIMKKQLKQLKRDFDSSEYGGSPFLGISKPVIKAHGSANAKEIKNACRQAISFVSTGLTEEIASRASIYVKHKSEETQG